MISNEQELKVTQERIGEFHRRLAEIRLNARPEEFEAVTSGYRLEIERMQAEVLDYLLRPLASEPEQQSV